MVRLVFGLGTRAVDRADDDYTRLVALNAPSRRPESNFDEVCEYSQHRVDYLDLAAQPLRVGPFPRPGARRPGPAAGHGRLAATTRPCRDRDDATTC